MPSGLGMNEAKWVYWADNLLGNKGRLRRGIAFYWRCEFRVVLLPLARTLRGRGRSFYAFLTLRRFRTAKTLNGLATWLCHSSRDTTGRSEALTQADIASCQFTFGDAESAASGDQPPESTA